MPEKFDFSKIEDQKEFDNFPKNERKSISDNAQEKAVTFQEKIKNSETDEAAEKERLDEKEILLELDREITKSINKDREYTSNNRQIQNETVSKKQIDQGSFKNRSQFLNLAATFSKEKISGVSRKSENKKEKRWSDFYDEALLTAVDVINNKMASIYNFPKIEISKEDASKIFKLKNLHKEGASGRYAIGGKLSIEESLIEKHKASFEKTYAIGVIIHELLHFCQVQILDSKKKVRRFGVEFLNKKQDKEKETFYFDELNEGITEIVNMQEILPEVCGRLGLDPEDYHEAYGNNIAIVEKLCQAVAIYYKEKNNNRYDTEDKVFNVFKKASFGSGLGGLSFGRIINDVYGKRSLEKFGNILQLTHRKGQSEITSRGKDYEKLVKFIVNDKERIIINNELNAENKIKKINELIGQRIMATSETDSIEIDNLLEEIEKVQLLNLGRSKSGALHYKFKGENDISLGFLKNNLLNFWKDFNEKSGFAGSRMSFSIPNSKDQKVVEDMFQANRDNLTSQINELMSMCEMPKWASRDNTEAKEVIKMIFNGKVINPEKFKHIGNRKIGRLYFEARIKMVEAAILEALSKNDIEKKEEFVKERLNLIEKYKKERLSGWVRIYECKHNKKLRIFMSRYINYPKNPQNKLYKVKFTLNYNRNPDKI